ncbi:MAG: 2-oxoacid:ferredoxin oxidoreductase subunit gamma [delta proteobacterium ML8_F1]|nr:MAG: 2-oxoacid:ferredoxin oxidoreductase subunit gamma [delta proteobacterium ML8_F1]
MDQKFIFAGFGGQGVMLMGQLITYAGMFEDLEVSWLPSYGPEMRGGTANCSVIVSDREVASPVISYDATTVVAMNLPSMDKFEEEVEKGGKLFVNSSLIERKSVRDDIDVYYIDANDVAVELGNAKAANMVMLGAILEITKVVSPEAVLKALEKIFGTAKAHLIPLNEEALKRGAQLVK